MTKSLICLRGMNSQYAGQTWQSGRLLRVGRSPDFEIVIPDSSVSRQHAEVVLNSQGWMVRDLGSTNGTFLNGVRIGRAEWKLHEGDVLQCGEIMLSVAILREQALSSRELLGGRVSVQCALHYSWEQLPALLASQKTKEQADSSLLTLLKTGRDFFGINSLESFLRSILWDAAGALDARYGAVVTRNEMTRQLNVRAQCRFGGKAGNENWVNNQLIELALEEESSLLFANLPEPITAGTVISGGEPTSILCAVLRSSRKQLGVLYLARGPEQKPFEEHELSLAEAVALNVSPSIDSLERLFDQKQTLFLHILATLAQMVELRDDYTGSHTQRVTDYALLLGEELKLSDQEIHYLRIGTPLHDLGKVGISDATLQKAGPLNAEELRDMKTHVLKGSALLETIPGLAPLLPIVRSHHERWDGSGYPDGLSGEHIPLLGRIVGVADAFDAMTSNRVYRRKLSLEDAFAELQRKAGSQFDPDLVRAFVRLRPRIEALFHKREGLSNTVSLQDLDKTKESLPLPA